MNVFKGNVNRRKHVNCILYLFNNTWRSRISESLNRIHIDTDHVSHRDSQGRLTGSKEHRHYQHRAAIRKAGTWLLRDQLLGTGKPAFSSTAQPITLLKRTGVWRDPRGNGRRRGRACDNANRTDCLTPNLWGCSTQSTLFTPPTQSECVYRQIH